MNAIGSVGYPPQPPIPQTSPVAKPTDQDGFGNTKAPGATAALATAQATTHPEHPLYTTA